MMEEDQLDLNINNYNFKELEQFFQLSPRKKYTAGEIEMREQEMKEVLLKSGNVSKKFKTELVDFLQTAKRWLMTVKCPPVAPTTIPKNPRLDSSTYPITKKAIEDSNRDNENFIGEISTTEDLYKITPTFGSHFIQKPTIQSVKHVAEYKYPSSNLNNIERRTITKVVCFNTLFRNNYETTNSNDVVWNLPFSLKNVVSMKLISIQLPIQYYMVSSVNKSNRFKIKLYNMVDFSDNETTIIIPDGNYLASEFQTVMNSIFTNIGNGLQYLFFDINEYTSHSIIRAKDINDNTYETLHCPYDPTSVFYSPEFYFEVDFMENLEYYNSNLNLNLGWTMGFNKQKYTVTKNNVFVDYANPPGLVSGTMNIYKSYLESEMSYGSSTYHYGFLSVNDFINNYSNSINVINGPNHYLQHNILAKFNITTSHNTVLFDDLTGSISNMREYFGPVTIEKLHIQLLNTNGKLIDILNNNYSFSIEFTMIYS
jgi:hypothetical protein